MLTLPDKYFVKNDTSFCILAMMDGKTESVYAHTRLEGAEILKKHGLISFYSCQGNDVKLFSKTFITVVGDKGQPVQHERLVPVKWEDVDITPGQAITIAATYVLEKNKVVKKFIKDVFKAA